MDIEMEKVLPVEEELVPEDDKCHTNCDGIQYQSRCVSLFLEDNKRRIDFVLYFRSSKDSSRSRLRREAFLAALEAGGLEMEENSVGDDVFIVIHAPYNVLASYAEVLKLRKSLKIDDDTMKQAQYTDKWAKTMQKFDCLRVFTLDPNQVVPITKRFTWPFSAEKDYLFDIPERRDTFFSSSERQLIVDYILRRASFRIPQAALQGLDPKAVSMLLEHKMNAGGDNEPDIMTTEQEDKRKLASHENSNDVEEGRDELNFGVDRLIKLGGLESAFPPHEPLPSKKELKHEDIKRQAEYNTRRMLYDTWVSLSNILKVQPLDYIRLYFGSRIGFYFAWLGFYTTWLLVPSVLGAIVVIYGFFSMRTDTVIEDICNNSNQTVMCPLCTMPGCHFWKLKESCSGRRMARVLDHPLNLVFTIFMAFWAVIFMEMWKRHQSFLAYQWNLLDLTPEDEPPRPEYLALIDKNYPLKENLISGQTEPYIPFWRRRLPIFFCTFSSVILLVVLVLAFIVGLIFYKLIMLGIFRSSSDKLVFTYASILTSVTASTLSLIVILILQKLYNRLAIFLTDIEHHRTQEEYENSITLKLFLLNFVNYYGPVFYIAFVQGKIEYLPGDNHEKSIRTEECSSSGCLQNLCIQMVIILGGKQVLSFLKEYTIPRVSGFIRRYLFMKRSAKQIENLTLYQRDNLLVDAGPRPLFDEYLEMMIQYGFVTIFVPAFPLAPFLALLNNILEIRGDADKFVTQYRRPVPRRVQNIGIWFEIMSIMSRLAVISNAAIIAFNTDIVPRFVYTSTYSEDGTLTGYLNHSLSYMETTRFRHAAFGPHNETQYCRYFQHREAPWEENKYAYTAEFWHILAAKFIFVFTFENIVFACTALIAGLIPDFPSKLLSLMHRETNLTNNLILKEELRRRNTDLSPGNQEIAFCKRLLKISDINMENENSEIKEVLFRSLSNAESQSAPNPESA